MNEINNDGRNETPINYDEKIVITSKAIYAAGEVIQELSNDHYAYKTRASEILENQLNKPGLSQEDAKIIRDQLYNTEKRRDYLSTIKWLCAGGFITATIICVIKYKYSINVPVTTQMHHD